MQKCKYFANYDSQLRITLPKCVAISQKLRIAFRFLNPAVYLKTNVSCMDKINLSICTQNILTYFYKTMHAYTYNMYFQFTFLPAYTQVSIV